MSTYTATIQWQRQQQDFLRQRYSRRHTWAFDGGLQVPASSSPSVVPLPWSDPQAVDPEEAFVASLSSCHMLWFLSLAAGDGWQVEAYVDRAEGVMARNAEGRLAMTVVTLHPEVQFDPARAPDAAQVNDLHHRAHEACFIAHSVRSEVRVQPVWPQV